MHLPLPASLNPLGYAPKAQSSLLDSLVSYWKLEEASGIRSDSVGVNHLTDNNTVTQAAGKIGNAAAFAAASNEYLSISNAAQVGLGFTSSFSISAWFYITSLPNSSTGIVCKGASVGTEGGYAIVLVDSANDLLRFIVSDGTNNRLVQHTFTGAITTGVYHHVVAWYDASNNSLSIQVDGGTVVSGTPAGSAPITTTTEFRMGRYTNTLNDLEGRMDEVAAWSRALTSAERASLYNGGTGNQYPFA